MPTIGLIVDGQYDRKAISALLQKARSKIKIKARQCGGGRNNSKAIGILKIFERERNVDFAIWVTDAENDDPLEVEKLMNEAVKRAQPLELKVKCIVAVRMLESWLLADEAAIRKAGGRPRKFTKPEDLQNPKADLRRLFDHPYTDALAERIALAARPKTIADMCPSFAKLLNAVAGN